MTDKILLRINRIIPQKWQWILDHAGFKKYLKNTGWMFVGQIFSLIVSFFVGAWLARYLGPENYGIISYVVAFVSIFGFVAHLGVHSILLRDLIEKGERENYLMGTSFFVLLGGSLLALFIVVILSFILESSLLIRSLIIVYSFTFLFSPFNIVSIFFQSRVEAQKNVRISFFSAIISSVLKILIILSGRGIFYLIIVFLLESILLAFFNVLMYVKSGYNIFSWRVDFKLLKKLLSSSWMLMLAAAASYIFTRVDQIMIKSFLGEVSVGIYSAALKLVEIWYFIPGIVCTSLLPAIINAKKMSVEKYKNRLKLLYVFLGGTAFVVAIFLTIFSDFIIDFLFGQEYIQSVSVLKIYAWASVGFFLSTGFYQYFLAENRLILIFYFYLFLMVLNILLNIFLIPRIGINGAALSTLISYFVGGFIIFLIKK